MFTKFVEYDCLSFPIWARSARLPVAKHIELRCAGQQWLRNRRPGKQKRVTQLFMIEWALDRYKFSFLACCISVTHPRALGRPPVRPTPFYSINISQLLTLKYSSGIFEDLLWRLNTPSWDTIIVWCYGVRLCPVLVKCKGYPAKFNTWLSAFQITDFGNVEVDRFDRFFWGLPGKNSIRLMLKVKDIPPIRAIFNEYHMN